MDVDTVRLLAIPELSALSINLLLISELCSGSLSCWTVAPSAWGNKLPPKHLWTFTIFDCMLLFFVYLIHFLGRRTCFTKNKYLAFICQQDFLQNLVYTHTFWQINWKIIHTENVQWACRTVWIFLRSCLMLNIHQSDYPGLQPFINYASSYAIFWVMGCNFLIYVAHCWQ